MAYRINFAETGELAAYAKTTAEVARRIGVPESHVIAALRDQYVAEIENFEIVPTANSRLPRVSPPEAA